MNYLCEKFDDEADQKSASIAVITPEKKLTYRELFYLSNTLAKRLIDLGVARNKLVAIVLEKGWEQVVATLGIIKAGAAYVPIEPGVSIERLSYLLEICEADIVLTQSKLNTLPYPTGKTLIYVDEIPLEDNVMSPAVHYHAEDLAYVIFTSGSTGSPKGVMISHKSALNTINHINQRFCVNKEDRLFALSHLTFDLSVYDIFGALNVGAALVIPDNQDIRMVNNLETIFFREKVTIWNSVPIVIDMFIEFLKNKYRTLPEHKLRLVLLSGDWIPLYLPEKIRAVFGEHVEVISLGGATEASIWSIAYPIDHVESGWKSIPYGKPLDKQSFYILDKDQAEVPAGESGELYIGGEGVALGYWKDCERTKKRFIHHKELGYLFRTGDLGKMLPDGNIEFLGRLDNQVKIAGHRVELSAIEKNILDLPDVKQAAVVDIGDGDSKKIVAYLALSYDTACQNAALETEHIQAWEVVYNNLIEESRDSKTPRFNTSGWNDTYTHTVISEVQMKEIVSDFISKLKQLRAKKILEVGCGTGLILFNLLEGVEQYHATDISEQAIEYIKTHLDTAEQARVQLMKLEADQLDSFTGNYDLVILNSVCQYFPSVQYFLDVIEKCIDKIAGSGHVVIGDIRSLDLLKLFHISKLMGTEAGKSLAAAEWHILLDKSLNTETELAMSPRLFTLLQQRQPRISHIEVQLKKGRYDNEINKFRYDVILHINQPKKDITEGITRIDFKRKLITEAAFVGLLEANITPFLKITQVANKHTYFMKDIVDEIENSHDEQHFVPHIDENEYLNNHSIYQIANDYQYQCVVTFNVTDPCYSIDILLVKKTHADLLKDFISIETASHRTEANQVLESCANFPLAPVINENVIRKIKKHLQTKLPKHMIPNMFFVLSEMPLSQNGKLDRKALAKCMSFNLTRRYKAPENEIQKKLEAIWGDILGLDKVSIDRVFYDVGGNSLLFVKMIASIQRVFGVEIFSCDILNHAITIEWMGGIIESKLAAQRCATE